MTQLKKSFQSKNSRRLIVFFTFIVVMFLFRIPILRGMYGFLDISTYPDKKYEYAIVLGGEPFDRSTAGAQLYLDNKIGKIICTGAHIPPPLAAVGMMYTEAEASKARLIHEGVPEEDIILLTEATSTKEEVDAINQYFSAMEKGSILLITTQTHTRRALRIFKKYSEPWEDMIAYGVAPSRYDAEFWWKNEYGFLAVFEEYLKTIFYWIAY